MRTRRWAAYAGVAAVAAGATFLAQAVPDLVSGDRAGEAPAEAASQDDAGPPAPRLSAQERISLQQALNDVVTAGSSGAVAELVVTNPSGSDSWNGVAGVAERATGAPVDPRAHFRIASLSKPFVAAVLLQLVGEGRAGLDDTVERHLPGLVAGGDEVTLRMLMSHTSGLFSYNRAMPSVLDDPHRTWRPEELVEIAGEHDPVFAPGTDVAYSNTNYVLVAMVIEKITGRPYTEEVTERIIEPLGLAGTSLPGDSAMPEPAMHAYLAVRPWPGADPEPTEITEFNPTRWYGTAQVVSTVTDINRFYGALLGGEVLDAPMLEEMLTVQATDDQGIGFGLGPKQHVLSCGVDVWMHSGNIPGYRNWTVHSEDRHFTMFQARYTEDPDPPAWDIIETALCPAETASGADPRPGDHPSEPVTGPEQDKGGS
ncbi:D-alanyl-D-alanine carboxypeptidase [Spinactinospora alkalitolerans]|uniref:D-alanyl-D-alanine carboxypeptidase n=1 Tax=Spinactinospora alkalitolerans TaxID=687207 RepID=A0A852U1K9_9ACTN|nr:serine hydrolase domain-containing protein [Spinactinospora alkalitolerans]NYE49467.1 D-alanyl-D-alanine carboxypeptidase [Spinactinospora alkalitolerans]